MEKPDFLTVKQTQEYLNISRSKLDSLVSYKLIPCYQPKGIRKRYFNRYELDEWIAQGRQATQQEIESGVNLVIKPIGYTAHFRS